MAFNEQEQEIIRFGIENGKSKEEVQQAITNFRLGIITPEKKEQSPTIGGQILRGVVKPLAKVATSGVNLVQDIAGQEETQPFSGSYLGEVTKVGEGFDPTKGFTPENVAALKDAVKQGVDIGTLISGGGSTGNVLKTGIKEGFRRGAFQGAKTFGTIGAVSGAGTGLEEGATVYDTLKNIALGGIGGAVLGGVTGGVTGAVSAIPKTGNILAKETGQYSNRLINGLQDTITKIDPQTKNILKTTSIEKFNNYVKAGEEAINNPRVLTPLERAGEKVYNQILPSIKEDLGNIGSQKAKSLASVSTTKMPNSALEVIDFVRKNTQALKLTKEERNLVEGIVSELEKLGKNPTLGSADKTVDLLQNTLYEKTKGLAIPVTSRVEGIVNQAIGKLNSSVKKSAEKALGSKEYSVLNDAYATKIDLFNRLNKAIGEDANRGGSLFKRFFSPQDSGTKNLFAEIKDLYGVDLAEDATLAKFIMDSLGDVRAKSLLEQIPLSKGGIVTKGLQQVERALTDPIGKARRVIEKRPQ